MKWKIDDIVIDNQVVVAPMAGVTSPAYRMILKEQGAGLIYTEMVSDKGMYYQNQKTLAMLDVHEAECPISLQIFGSDPLSMGRASAMIDQMTQADIIDINMGCPVTKVVKGNAGSKLMLDSHQAADIVRACVDHSNKPVTVKIRTGWDSEHINAVAFAKSMEMAGASAIAIHGRTRSQMYSGTADWDIIRQVKAAVCVPVIGNGDIKTPEDAKRMLEETGCDAVMIGRGVLGNPWLVGKTVAYLEQGTYDPRIQLMERKAMILHHMKRLIQEKGDRLGVLEMRTHAAWYIKGLKNSSVVKTKIVSAESVHQFVSLIEDYFSELSLVGN
jgi:nifR3 family TIM-barrel protein